MDTTKVFTVYGRYLGKVKGPLKDQAGARRQSKKLIETSTETTVEREEGFIPYVRSPDSQFFLIAKRLDGANFDAYVARLIWDKSSYRF